MKDIRDELEKLNNKQKDSYMLNLVLTSAIFVFACFEILNRISPGVVSNNAGMALVSIIVFTGLFLLVLFKD